MGRGEAMSRFWFLAFLSGVAMAVQGSWNAVLAKAASVWTALLVLNAAATVTTAALLVAGGRAPFGLERLHRAPGYVFLAGPVGVLITYLVVVSIPRLGVAATATAIVVGQVGTAALIDHWGLFGLERHPLAWWQLGGVALLALGAWLLLHRPG